MLRDPTHVIGRVSSTASFSQAIKSPILNVTPTPCPPTRTDSGELPPWTARHGVRSHAVPVALVGLCSML